MKAPLELRRPLGLALSGGGALGAWQGGFLRRLDVRGVRFDSILGLSIGALNGAACWLGRADLLADAWTRMSLPRVLRPSPRLNPPSLFSSHPIRALLSHTADEEGARRQARCPLTVVSHCEEESRPIYARFCPEGRWDADLGAHLVASCAIPWVFPPVRLRVGGRPLTLIDGGIPGREPLSFAPLAECAEVLVLEMMRDEEAGRRRMWPLRWEQEAREGLHRSVSTGLAGLSRANPRVRVRRLQPSRRLDFTMLSFRAGTCSGAFRLGEEDADRFLETGAV